MSRSSQITFVTFLSRHGVRSPTESEMEFLAPFATLPFPQWDVPPGELSRHGHQNVRHLGAWYGLHYGPALAPDGEVLPPELIYIRADKNRRDVMTAQEWARGFVGTAEPDVTVHQIPYDDPRPYDPVFLGVDSGMNEIEGLGELVRGRIGDDLPAVIHAFRSPIMAMQDALGTAICQPEMYNSANTVGEDGSISGTLEVAQVLSDILILERANGWAFDRVGWGRIDDASLHEIAALRTFTDRILGRAPSFCRAQSSNMAAHLLAGLEQAVTGESVPGLEVPPDARVAAYFGHDSGVQSLGGLLNLEWQSRSFVPNQTPPAGALLFELHRDSDTGEHFVRIFFIVATLDQMVHGVPLSPYYEPNKGPIGLPRDHGCATSLDIPWHEFRASIIGALDPGSVSPALGGFVAPE